MDQSEGSAKIVRGRGRNKRKWTMDEDEELVKALCEVSTDPRFRAEGGGFKNCYTQGIESLLAQRLPGRGIKASPHVDSRLKVLKRKFHAIKEMLASPGFSWDGSRKVVRCEKQRYDEYCKDNPRARGMYGVPFPHFDVFDAVYGKDRAAREVVEVSEEATADMENGNTSEAGDDEAEEDRMCTGQSGCSLDATSSYKKQERCKNGGKRNRTESNGMSPDMLKDVCDHYQRATHHVNTMAEAMGLFKEVHRHFKSVVQHANAMAAAMEAFKDAHNQFQSVVQNVSKATTAMEQFKDAHDHFQSITKNGTATAAVIEPHADLQERLSPEVPQQDVRVKAIAEMQKLGFTGSEVVNAASVFAKEPDQMGMFLALPEIYRREYILKMLNGVGTDSQNAQILGDTDPGSKQNPGGIVLGRAGETAPTTLDDLEWLKMKNTRFDVDASWSNLKISEDGSFHSPAKKRDTNDKTTVNSPVSTLAICWLPQAALAPLLKFRRGGGEIAT